MRDLPAGSVTFLFTDVEGSTRLLHELGPERYAAALQEHRRVLRDCIGRHDGKEVDTQGDAFFVAFPSAESALAAARDAQEELAAGPLVVRMGVHTGHPHVTGEGYVGEDVHLGARVAAAGHGGQVLLTAATRELVAAEVTDLGEHRLKDFGAAVAIFQLGNERFPPLKTISNTNLPRPASSFLGRDREVADVAARVRQARLVTLTGPGGTGKTRLSIEAAAELVGEFKAGLFWVGLATLRDPALVLDTISKTLGAQGDLTGHIGERELLLLLDNFEQVVDAAPRLSLLLQACPNLRLLVTSRELLRIQGEIEYAVPPLAEPEAVELFCARSQLAADDDVAELCRRLDNLPLAVELAASRTTVLSPGQILVRLRQRLDLLKGGRDADPRQQTLRATIEWSHDLLDEEEQLLFRRLAAFAGGCTYEAAEEVADADLDLLQSLVEKSLVRRTGDRFWMLETIREFAVERLEAAGEADEILRKLAVHMLDVGESARLTAESEPPDRPEIVRPELDNFRRAIDWATVHDAELALRLAVSLELFWALNDAIEGARVLRAVFGGAATVPPELRARALRVLGAVAWMAGEFEAGGSIMEESLAAFEELGDERGVAIVKHRLGIAALNANDLAHGRALLEASLQTCRHLPDPKLEGDVLRGLAVVEQLDGNAARALEFYEQSIEILERIGHTWVLASALRSNAELLHELGETSRAEDRARESLRLSHELLDRQATVYSLALLAGLAVTAGNLGRAGRLWGALDSEAARGPVGYWEAERDEYETRVVRQGPEFEGGCEAGRRLSLDEAVELALSVDSPA